MKKSRRITLLTRKIKKTQSNLMKKMIRSMFELISLKINIPNSEIDFLKNSSGSVCLEEEDLVSFGLVFIDHPKERWQSSKF
jgi:hypothetical protein